MEDSVGDEERREQGETTVKARQEDEQVEAGRGGGGGGGEPGEEGGFLSAMASKIGAAMAGGNENSGTVNAAAAPSGEVEKKGDGHGGGGIFQKSMSSSHAPSTDSGASETEEVEGEEKTLDGEQGGILSSMASRIGMAMSGANGNGHHHSAADDAVTSNGDAVDHKKGEDNGNEANGGGILSSMVNKIGMAMSSANGNGDHSTAGNAKMGNGDAVDHVKGEEKTKEEEANGGILRAMASKIGMSVPGANREGNHGDSGDDATTSNGHASGGSKVEEKRGEANGRGLVDQIMSNLPSEDQAPEADEASLLIAIIED